MRARTRYSLPGNITQDQFLRQLQVRFPVELTSLGTQTRRYFDTFDWRLFRRERALCQTHDTVALWSLDHRPVSERTPCLALLPRVSEWLESPLKAHLMPLVSIRALMERAVVHAAYLTLAERAAPQRPVANIVFEESAAKDYGRLVPFPTQVEVSAYAEATGGLVRMAGLLGPDSGFSERSAGDPVHRPTGQGVFCETRLRIRARYAGG